MESVRDGGRVRSRAHRRRAVHRRAPGSSAGTGSTRVRSSSMARTRSWASGSAARRSATRRHAWRTVVWLRPPKARPTAGSVASVCSRTRNIATCRAHATWAVRQVESELLAPQAEGGGGEVLDPLGRGRPDGAAADAAGSGRRSGAGWVEAVEHLTGDGRVERPAGQRREGDDADEGPLERTDVRRHAVRDEVEDRLVVQRDAVVGDALAQHRHPRPTVGRLDVRDEARLEALAQAVVDAVEVPRHPVRGQDELAAGGLERVEGVEELLLGLRLLREELDVVDEEHADLAVERLEALDAALAQRGDELVRERLDRDAADGRPAAVRPDVVPDRVEQVGLADARRAVDEERVVGLPRAARRRPARRRGRSGWPARSRTGRRCTSG